MLEMGFEKISVLRNFFREIKMNSRVFFWVWILHFYILLGFTRELGENTRGKTGGKKQGFSPLQ